jgi:hypothetical protein
MPFFLGSHNCFSPKKLGGNLMRVLKDVNHSCKEIDGSDLKVLKENEMFKNNFHHRFLFN